MSAAIPLRTDFDAERCRALARRCVDAVQSCRLLAIAAVYEGKSRTEAARIGGMDRQTLRDWVHHFNEEGPDGLKNRKAPGAACRLNTEQLAEFAAMVEAGPDLERDGVVRWRRYDLVRIIEERFGVIYAERSISSLLARLGFVHMSARPQHPRQDGAVIAAYKKTSPPRSAPI